MKTTYTLTDHGGSSSECSDGALIEVVHSCCTHERQLHMRVGINAAYKYINMYLYSIGLQMSLDTEVNIKTMYTD